MSALFFVRVWSARRRSPAPPIAAGWRSHPRSSCRDSPPRNAAAALWSCGRHTASWPMCEWFLAETWVLSRRRLELCFLESRVQVVVFEGAALAELVQLERERQSARVKLFREVQLHEVEQPAARRALRRHAAACADFQDGMHETRVALAPVGDAKLVAGDRPYPYAAGRKHRGAVHAQGTHVLREVAAQVDKSAVAAQVAAVFERQVRHGLFRNAH